MIKPLGNRIILKIEGILRITTIAMFLFSFMYGNIDIFQSLMRVKNSKLEIKMCKITGRMGGTQRSNQITLFGVFFDDSTKNVQFTVGYRKNNTIYYHKSLNVDEGAVIPIWYEPESNFAYAKFHKTQNDLYIYYLNNVTKRNLMVTNLSFFIPLILLLLVVRLRKSMDDENSKLKTT